MTDWGGKVAAWFGAVAAASTALTALVAQTAKQPLHGQMRDLFIAMMLIAAASFLSLLLTGPRALWLAWRNGRQARSTELRVPEWVVERPTEVAAVAQALVRGRDKAVGITTSLQGAGGFGKTTLALMVCTDRRVRRRFGRHVYMVTVGQDLRASAALAAKVNDVIRLVSGEETTFTDPELAGIRLGALLDTRPPRLLVLDDVWEPQQLAPFTRGGRRCSRLVTTRVPGLLADPEVAVLVDQMSAEQAWRLLMAGLPPLDPALVEGLLAVTGRWPLLLRLVNEILASAVRAGADVRAAGAMLLERLRAGGPAVVDDVTGVASSVLLVGQPQDRARAVRATIEASTGLLSSRDAQRFTELAVFAEDEVIPFSLAARLWRATDGLDDLQASQLCARLARLALVSAAGDPTSGMTLHRRRP